jgi:broad specificity phosphatase PhoE
MPRCPATKRDGGRCTTIVKPPQTHCYQHDPDRAEERRRNASRAARSGGKEIRDLKRRISDVIDAVLEGSQERGRAAVAIQGFNALRGVLELERKMKETEELEARIEALEQPQEGGRQWGA